jgi:hypothetical protein
MTSQEKFSLLRGILQTLGLSKEAVDDIVDRITGWLSIKDDGQKSAEIKYPYLIRDDFLSPAELNFYRVLKSTVSDWALIFTKVNLGDLFYAKSNDYGEHRIYTNKIDRKHVDFILCDLITVRPILGIELDDKSHQRQDRQERDEFVENVFAAAKLPLARIPVKHSYAVAELNSLLQQYKQGKETVAQNPVTPQTSNAAPRCPKCGSEMVLRTAKRSTNLGEKFWGCPNYPQCNGILKIES